MAVLTGEVLQGLRSGLDHLAYGLWQAGPGGANGGSTSHVYFPIFEDAAKYAAGVQAKVKGMSQNAIDTIDAIKPYRGGNDILWMIHKLNNIDKHRFLIVIGTAYNSVDVGAYMSGEMRRLFPGFGNATISAFLRPADRLFPLKEGDDLFIDRSDGVPNKDIRFSFDIAFGEPGIVEGEPLIPTLHEMVSAVEQVIERFNSAL